MLYNFTHSIAMRSVGLYRYISILYHGYVIRKKKHLKSDHFFSLISVFLFSIALLTVVAIVYQLYFTSKIQCANTISCKSAPKLEIESNTTGVYNGHLISVPNISLAPNESRNPVLGTKSSTDVKHIYVNLDTQTLSAFEGKDLFMQTPISSGLWGKTPKGDFTIWSKFRATRMTGGSGADYYDLPNVPYVMFFSNDEVDAGRGFSIHGTYWHNNFGHAMSHGCVNMKTTDVAKLFEWADGPKDGKKGTMITIYDDSET